MIISPKPGRILVMALFTTSMIISLAGCGSADDRESTAQRPPNIVLFLADDHGQWAAGPYGNNEVQTPALDQLAEAGVLMTNATSPSPVCSPARISLLTGRLPSQHGIHDFLSESPKFAKDWLADEVLLSELLQKAGYRTGLIGKWHCSATSLDPDPSFDRWLSYDQGPEDWPNQYLHQGKVHLSDQGTPVSVDGFQLEHLGEAARNFITAGTSDQPYFLLFCPTETHSPFTGHPEDLVERYRNQNNTAVPAGESTDLPAAADAFKSPDDSGETLAQYYAAVHHQDTELAKLLELLEARGERENTLVIYTSDHGMMVGHHGLLGKSNATVPQNMYEESIRVPMVLSWPEGFPEAGISLEIPYDHLDLFQTIVDVAGLEISEDLQRQIDSPGTSLLPRLHDSDLDWRSFSITEHGNIRQINNGKHKIVRRYPPLDPRFGDELYDLVNDPREKTNLMGNPSYQSIGKELGGDLDGYFGRYEIPERSGRNAAEQGPFNGIEPWKKLADRLEAGF